MKLIIGLGNIGETYAGTRHNLGFDAVDAFASAYDAAWKEDRKRNAMTTKAAVGDQNVVLAKPTTYMNRSGDAVQALISFYKVDLKDVLIIHDDMDLEPGQIRFKAGGSAAGHHGIEHIYERLGNTDVQRMRIGIGRPEEHIPAEDWVLGKLSPEHAPNALDIVSGMRDWIEYGLETASNRWN
jgi:PTH1 family peptidyl-tRNA hydrolase